MDSVSRSGGFRYVEPKQNDDLRKAFFNKNKGAQK